MRQSEKQRVNLARRRADYDKMIEKSNNSKGGWSAYRRPGSNKKRK